MSVFMHELAFNDTQSWPVISLRFIWPIKMPQQRLFKTAGRYIEKNHDQLVESPIEHTHSALNNRWFQQLTLAIVPF